MSAVLRPRHPGQPTLPRRLAQRATAVREFDLPIAAGDELFAFARRFAADIGGCAAMLNFDAVAMRPIAIHVPEPDPTGRQIMRYGAATVIDAGCELVSAQMSVGGTAGAPMLHGHGQVRRADGSRLGGHLADGGCFAARDASVRCTVLDGLRLEPAFDAETNFSLLVPVPADAAVPARGPGWLLRLRPDEDLVGALADLARTEGIARPRVVGGVGSLMHATFLAPDGARRFVDGPGVEIVTLRSEGDALRMVVADLNGDVHEGVPLAGGNPICVTIELFVVEAA